MAYTANGAWGCRARHPSRLGIVAWIFTRRPKIWFSFPHDIDLGPGRRAIRRSSLYLWHGSFFSDCVVHCGAIEHRDRGVSNGTRAALDSPAARFSHRDAGGDSERDSRVMGHFRNDSMAAELSVSVAETPFRLDTVFHRTDLRSEHARR